MKKATSSEGFKEQALSKVFSRGDRTVQAVAEELNLSVHTLKGWMKKPLPEPPVVVPATYPNATGFNRTMVNVRTDAKVTHAR